MTQLGDILMSTIKFIPKNVKLEDTELYSKIFLGFILLFAAVLYFSQVSAEPLWRDEFFSIQAIDNPTMPERYFSPVYISLLSLWSKLSRSGAWLRTLSACFSLASILVIYHLGRRTANQTVGLVAALLFALSPIFIHHAHEVRYYPNSTFLNLSGSLVLSFALAVPRRLLILGWLVIRLLAIFTLPLNLLMLIPDLVLISYQFYRQQKQLLTFGTAWLFTTVAGTTHVVNAYRVAMTTGGGEYYEHHPKPGIILIGTELVHLTVFWPIKHLFGVKQVDSKVYINEISQRGLWGYFIHHFGQSNMIWLVFYMGLAIVMALLIGIALLQIRAHRKILWVAVWAFLPAALMLLFSYLSRPIWHEKYLTICSPYFLLLLSCGFMVVWKWRQRLALVLATLYLTGSGYWLIHYYTTVYRVYNGESS